MQGGSFSQAGFSYQNTLAAIKILELLDVDADLEFIELENFDKGAHIDDIIVTRTAQIEFYQVKWSEDAANSFTIQNLVYETEEDKKGNTKGSLWEKMIRGYRQMQTTGKTATITLYSNRKAGTSVQKAKGFDKSLAQLVAFQKKTYQAAATPLNALNGYADFKPVLDKIQTDKGPAGKEFEDFFKTLRFTFGAGGRQELEFQLENKATFHGLQTTQVDRLLRLVIDWSIENTKITRGVLLTGLGINDRFADKLSHTFKIDEALYVENSKLFTQLDHALNQFNGGYIFIEGVPGAGKSTALTKYFAQSKTIRFYYYCFLPEDHLTASLRMQGNFFLKSLCISIESAFNKLYLPMRYSDNYEEKFSAYLGELSKFDKKVIILVDGLDHVHRNRGDLQQPLTSKIPATLPDNVYILITSQYKDALPDSIKTAIAATPGRDIQIDRFDESKIKAYLDKRGLYLDAAQIALLAEKSEGIPLYLRYISSGLERELPRNYEEVISGFPFLENANIITYHTILFEQLQKDANALWIFALLALRREYTSLELIKDLLAHAGKSVDTWQIVQTIKSYNHLLKERDGKYYSIFHNSFREFLIQHTTELQPAIWDGLIGYYESAPFEIEAYRNYFQHLFQAGKFETILAMVDDGWIGRSWQSFKSTNAILENLHIAWQAAVAIDSITEFVRIAFLILQVGTIHQNFDHYNFNTTISFLEAGLVKESLNTIWDGEYPLISGMDFFNRYVFWYYEKTQNLIPLSTAEPFFNRFLAEMQEPAEERDRPNFEFYFKAKALYENAKDWFEEFDGLKKSVTDDQQKRIGRFLAENGKLSHLLKFYEAEKEPPIRNYLCAMLVWALAVKNAPETVEFQAQLDFELLKKNEKIFFVLQLLTHNQNELATPYAAKMEIVPFVEDELIDKDEQYNVKPAFYELFDDLKVWYFADIKNYSLFELRLSSVHSYARQLYNAFSSAALIWVNWKTGKTTGNIVAEQKKVIDQMIIDQSSAARIIQFRETSHFIQYHIQEIYSELFAFFEEVNTDDDLSEIISYWHGKHRSGGFRAFKSDLEFAAAIKDRIGLRSPTLALLQNAESVAHSEAGTATLVENLYWLANGFGQAGFKNDFLRLYNDVFPLACGVNHRKDYQFVEIIPIMDEMHRLDPAGTLNRFADIYHLLYKIKDAGNSRMMHICLSYLIKFINQYYPELGFYILQKDDLELGREEAMEIILDPLITSATEAQLPYLWAIMKTGNKWEDFGSEYDDHLKNLYKVFFEKITPDTDQDFVRSCYQYVYRQFTVEQGTEKKIGLINDILSAKGLGGDFRIAPAATAEKDSSASPFQQPKEVRGKFMNRPEKLSKEALSEMGKLNFKQLYDYVSSYTLAYEINKITPEWAEIYHQFVEHLGEWYQSLVPELQKVIKSNLWQFKRHYLAYKTTVAERIKNNPQAFHLAVDDLFEEIDHSFPATGLKQHLVDHMKRRLLERHLFTKTQQHRSKLYEAISASDIDWLTQHATRERIGDWAAFVIAYFENETIITCLVNLSQIAEVWDEALAKDLTKQAFSYLDHSYSGNKRIIEKLLGWFYKLDPEAAKHQLLKTFQTGHQEYTYDILTDLLRYVKPWAPRFNDPGLFPAYYAANYAYNQKLTEGLPEPGIATVFIRNHQEKRDFAESVTVYLLGLFDYPIVKIRPLAIGALLELYNYNAAIIARFAVNELQSQSANFKEHFVVLLHALSVKYPEDVAQILNECPWLLSDAHFNIRQTTAELILSLGESKEITNSPLLEIATLINRPPLLAPPEILRLNWPQPLRALSDYQKILLIDIDEHRQSEVEFSRIVNAMLIENGWDAKRLREAETPVHQEKNNNFGPIEINGPGYQVVQETINTVFVEEIAKRHFTEESIYHIKDEFRLYDPTDYTHLPVKKPAYISWTIKNTKARDFMSFKDSDEIMDQILSRQGDWLTIFESGDEWTDGLPDHFNSYFTLSLFLTDKQGSRKQIDHFLQDSIPYFRHDNLYRTEILKYFDKEEFKQYSEAGISPIIGASPKRFRHEKDEAIAVVLPNILSEMDLVQVPGSLNFVDSTGSPAIEMIEWQGIYKDYSTRRFEPDSKGTTLNIRKNILEKYVRQSGKQPYLYVALRRSTDRYKPESQMDWKTAEFIRKINLWPST
ncbi:MAG TPA: dsDNA nuclease domain-containing protein [Mucilaginibacter sp.]|jgi:hypothetical protein|nr:dsDNA nuclease domain-containing protein [Mucilaginibacter sp.]